MKLTFYDPATGRIRQRCQCSDDQAQFQIIAGLDRIEGYGDPATQYVVSGALVSRPINPVVLSGTTLQNVPLGATVRYEQEQLVASAATIELEFPFAGSHVVTVQAFPYLDQTFTVVQP